jgi:hypothetical protein
MAGESELMMNYRLCKENKPCNNNKRLGQAGHLVRISDDRTIKNVLLAKLHRRKAGTPKLWWLHSIENKWKSTGVNTGRRKQKNRSARSIILKEILVKLYANEEAICNLYHTSNLWWTVRHPCWEDNHYYSYTLLKTNFLSTHMHILMLCVSWESATQKYQQCKPHTQPKQIQSNVGILGQLINQHTYWKCFSMRKFWLESQIFNTQSNRRGFTWPNLVTNMLSRAMLSHLLPVVSDSWSSNPPPPLQKISRSKLQIYQSEMGGRTNPQHLVAEEPDFLQVPSYSSIITAILSLYIQ